MSSKGNSSCSGIALGPLWLMGWLFSLGFVGFGFWKALLALLIWPYYLGVALR